MNKKVRAKQVLYIENETENPKKMRFYLNGLENDSIRNLIRKTNLIKSEGKLAKEINFSDVW